MISSKRIIQISALILFLGLILRIYGEFVVKSGLSHDESVTYQCAAAKEKDYVDASAKWQDSLMQVSDVLTCYQDEPGTQFKKIAEDLSLTDIHPPLFFWILHVVYKWIGFHFYTGLLINLCCTLLLLLLTYKIAYRLTSQSTLALLASAVWFLSPAVMQIDFEARHYQLFGTLAILSLWMQFKLYEGGLGMYRLQWLLVLVNAAGILTHFYFGFIMLFPFAMILRKNGITKPFIYYTLLQASAVVLFLAVYPQFFQFLKIYGQGSEESAFHLDPARIKPLLYSSLQYFSNVHLLKYVYLGLLLILVFFYLRYRLKHKNHPEPAQRYFFGAAAYLFIFSALLYVTGISPPHATGEQYFSYFWPLFSIFLVSMVSKVLPGHAQTLVLLHLLVLVSGAVSTVKNSPYVKSPVNADWVNEIESTEVLVSDNIARGFLPRSLVYLKPSQKLYIMTNESVSLKKLSSYSRISLFLSNNGNNEYAILDSLVQRGYTLNSAKNEIWKFYTLKK